MRYSGSAICFEICLALTIRYLAGGSICDINEKFGLSFGGFYRSFGCAIDEIKRKFTIHFDIGDEDTLGEI